MRVDHITHDSQTGRDLGVGVELVGKLKIRTLRLWIENLKLHLSRNWNVNYLNWPAAADEEFSHPFRGADCRGETDKLNVPLRHPAQTFDAESELAASLVLR